MTQKMIKLINNAMYTILCMGYIFIYYIVFFKLLLQCLPNILFVSLSPHQIAITAIMILGCICKIYMLLIKEEVIKSPNPKNSLVIWIKTKLETLSLYIYILWVNFYHIFVEHSLKLNYFILRIAKFVSNDLTDYMIYGILLVFEILPKLIIVIAFLVDIYYFHKFLYFYKCLWLLVLPLIYYTLRAILTRFCEDNFEDALSCINLYEERGKGDDTKSYLAYEFKEDYEPAPYIKNLADFLENTYFPLRFTRDRFEDFDEITKKYRINWLYMGIWILYIIGWTTILYFGIFPI